VDLFCETEGHLSVVDLCRLLAEQGAPVPSAAVAKVMRLLSEYGIAQEKRFEDNQVRYEHHHLGPSQHHDHLICVRCGMVEEFYEPQIEALQDEVIRRHGFRPLKHRMDLYGLCRSCAATHRGVMPLALVSQGERVRVMELRGGRRLRGRLADLRIMPGSELELIAASGNLIVGVGQTRVGLGWGEARQIMVVPIEK